MTSKAGAFVVGAAAGAAIAALSDQKTREKIKDAMDTQVEKVETLSNGGRTVAKVLHKKAQAGK